MSRCTIPLVCKKSSAESNCPMTNIVLSSDNGPFWRTSSNNSPPPTNSVTMAQASCPVAGSSISYMARYCSTLSCTAHLRIVASLKRAMSSLGVFLLTILTATSSAVLRFSARKTFELAPAPTSSPTLYLELMSCMMQPANCSCSNMSTWSATLSHTKSHKPSSLSPASLPNFKACNADTASEDEDKIIATPGDAPLASRPSREVGVLLSTDFGELHASLRASAAAAAAATASSTVRGICTATARARTKGTCKLSVIRANRSGGTVLADDLPKPA
mmetsp:Transcript_107439/g.309307  ORF Transcript_107439/g.309307 Transcript_107439/m.309307 type:complete len:275 (+) Transcript_107439:414-1238(+)